MVMIYTLIKRESDYLEDKIVKTWKFKILGVVNQWDKTIIILDIHDTKNFNNSVWNSTMVVFYKLREW